MLLFVIWIQIDVFLRHMAYVCMPVWSKKTDLKLNIY